MEGATVTSLPRDDKQGDPLELALCRQVGTELFYPHIGKMNAPAKKVCGMCELRETACMRLAFDMTVTRMDGWDKGVFAGLDGSQRKALAPLWDKQATPEQKRRRAENEEEILNRGLRKRRPVVDDEEAQDEAA